MAATDLIVSIHIPKTGGSTFGSILERAFPGQVAYAYNPANAGTHPLLRERGAAYHAEVLERLAAGGIKVIHGHLQARRMRRLIPDPRRYWTWVRDPAERIASLYHYFSGRADRGRASPDFVARFETQTLLDFARDLRRDQQVRAISPFSPADLGFLGVTERYTDSLTLLGLPPLTKARNVNKARPALDEATRAHLQALDAEDARLHAEALGLLDRRLANSS
jgi:hypothetical protein